MEHDHINPDSKIMKVDILAVSEIEGAHDTIEVVEEIVLVEIEDLEQHGKHGTKPRRAKRYRIVIDKQAFVVDRHDLTGTQLLAKVNKTPDKWTLTEKLHGGRRERIEPDQIVDFSARGIERFETAPKSATNGEMALQGPLTTDDIEFLNASGYTWKLVQDVGGFALVLTGYRLPRAFNPETVDLMIRIGPLYPATQLDMFNTFPSVCRKDGHPIPNLTSFSFRGQIWQQWSRHRSSWNATSDCVATHMALVENALHVDAA